VWVANTGRELHTLRGHGAAVRSLTWSPDGRRLVSGDLDGTVKIWDAALGQELLTLREHNAVADDVVWSADGRQLAVYSMGTSRDLGRVGGVVKVWDASPGYEREKADAGKPGKVP
jgi:WD40 repeat protein